MEHPERLVAGSAEQAPNDLGCMAVIDHQMLGPTAAVAAAPAFGNHLVIPIRRQAVPSEPDSTSSGAAGVSG